jgi:hypothetical protein
MVNKKGKPAWKWNTETFEQLRSILESKQVDSQSVDATKFSVDAPPGKIENRVFVGGNYVLMPVLREIAKVIRDHNLQPIVAYDFDIPLERTREYTLRLLFQCKMAIFEVTLGNGQLVEIVRASGFGETSILQVFMAMDERREPPKTMSVMVWQARPPPQGYLSLDELGEIVGTFLATLKRSGKKTSSRTS